MDPVSLQQKVFIDLMIFSGRRDRENLRDSKVKDFEFSKQGGGDKEHRYERIQRDELTKNHKENTNTAVGKMYEIMSNVMSESLRTDATSTTFTVVPDRNIEDMFQIVNDSDIIDFMLFSDSQMNSLSHDITSTNSSQVATCE
ncbi:Hypothetical predicted protein [Mytilus galloprovincialis]|nr:Hypothetical predicted protein [Mytilus galloprovincialis]